MDENGHITHIESFYAEAKVLNFCEAFRRRYQLRLLKAQEESDYFSSPAEDKEGKVISLRSYLLDYWKDKNAPL